MAEVLDIDRQPGLRLHGVVAAEFAADPQCLDR